MGPRAAEWNALARSEHDLAQFGAVQKHHGVRKQYLMEAGSQQLEAKFYGVVDRPTPRLVSDRGAWTVLDAVFK